jgi:tetratricopeptide (TPR) repeat protein
LRAGIGAALRLTRIEGKGGIGIVGRVAVDRLLVQAVEHYEAGRPSEAEALCGDILSQDPAHISALHLSAVIAFVTDRAAEGAVLLQRVFSVDPHHAPAFGTLGDALAVKGEREGALAAFERAVTCRPRDAGLQAKLGTALFELSRYEEAEAAYRKAIELDPTLARAHFNLAAALTEQERLAEAEESYRAVIARDPAYPGVWLNLGNVLTNQKKFDEAVAAYHQALKAHTDDATLHCNLGGALRGRGQFEAAISHCRRATELAPDSSLAFAAQGVALYQAGRPADAIEAYRQASVLDPGNAVILHELSASLCECGRIDEAVAACELALALDPDYAPAHTNLGIILDRKNDLEGAIAAHRRAVVADSDYALGHANLAFALRKAGWIDEALAVSHRAVALAPDHPQTRFNHAHNLLLNGDFKKGFADYRWERKCKDFRDLLHQFSEPEWKGEPFSGRTLLLFAEYGLGDALQFVRYVPMAAALGGSIVLEVQPVLASLMRTMPGVTVVNRGGPLPSFDLQLPLMSLARVFGTTLDTVPAAVPYLHPDPEKVARWCRALGDTGSFKVGVVWAGNLEHHHDQYRSLSAAALLLRLVMPGVQLYSLQKEPRPADVSVLAGLGGDIIDLGPALGDFADTAAAVAALDLVIVVDTSVAHLAGALGRPVWPLSPYALDWRWLRDREDSPWYPTMRLFRQHKPEAWDGVLARLPDELARVAAGERHLIWPPSMGERAA